MAKGQYRLARIQFWGGPKLRSRAGQSCPHFGRILFVAGCFRTSLDGATTSETRVIPRKLSFDAAMHNAQNVFESLQGRKGVVANDRAGQSR